MSMLKNRLLTVVIGAAVVVGAANLTAYAANGHALLLGRVNHSLGATTVINDGRGPALNLQTGKRHPPISVTSRKLVENLNADTVDGLDGKSLRTNATVFTIPGGDSQTYLLKGIQPGWYLGIVDITMETSSTAGCGLLSSHTGQYLSINSAASDGVYAAASATAVIHLPKGSSLEVTCNNVISDSPLFNQTVALSPMGKITTGKVEK